MQLNMNWSREGMDRLADHIRTDGELAETPALVLLDMIATLRLRIETAEEWKRAVEDAAVVSWVPIEGKTPREAVNALLAWEAQVALDPAVSEGAVKLQAEAYAKGQRDMQERTAIRLDNLAAEQKRWHNHCAATVIRVEAAAIRSLPIKERP